MMTRMFLSLIIPLLFSGLAVGQESPKPKSQVWHEDSNNSLHVLQKGSRFTHAVISFVVQFLPFLEREFARGRLTAKLLYIGMSQEHVKMILGSTPILQVSSLGMTGIYERFNIQIGFDGYGHVLYAKLIRLQRIGPKDLRFEWIEDIPLRGRK